MANKKRSKDLNFGRFVIDNLPVVIFKNYKLNFKFYLFK